MDQQYYGETKTGEKIYRITLENNNGMSVSLLNYGCIIQSIIVLDKHNQKTSVCLSYDNISDYENNDYYFGALIGRSSGRIGNGQFNIDSINYQLDCNNNGNNLHGGIFGFNTKVYDFTLDKNSVLFHRISSDGESGFPGNLDLSVRYSLHDNNSLEIDYKAVSDTPTLVNLTNHSYFNLNGAGSGEIGDHLLSINAQDFLEIDKNILSTGVISGVEGTPFDFRKPHLIGERINADNEQIQLANGYDHCFILDESDGLKSAAIAVSEKSGIKLEVLTTKPCIQFYSGNFIETKGKDVFRGGFCLETEYFPYSTARLPILKKGELYTHQTLFCFGCVN